ncbi:FAD-dependent monooxygenase sdnN [Cladobotryum mycophilum]|uniref:FAD-dependent monooxygenase sdnN n=1 Tax=Cladobotryum mycophilum TaxID=491253 RepID=A0ABR0S8X1_9HYPO
MEKGNNFKVVVIGGGPAGLTAAHALGKAGIDFVVLERREQIVLDLGANISLWPSTLRIIYQFGLYDELVGVSTQLKTKETFTSDGYKLKQTPFFSHTTRNFGTAPIAVHRSELIRVLHEGLPESSKEKILTDKNVLDIVQGEGGVTVTCTDGTVYEGSMVIGADGVHSNTRRLMRKMALLEDSEKEWDLEDPFTTTYKCIWFNAPRPEGAIPGSFIETHHQDKSIIHITGEDFAWLFLFEKLPEPTNKPPRCNEDEIEPFAQRFAEFQTSDNLKVKELWAKKIGTGITNLEEGVANNWNWGRIVLAGDSCHKFTPHAGLGYANGVQDIVVLCNRIHDAVAAAPNGLPSTSDLTARFEDYQAVRALPLKKDCAVSGLATRIHTWASTPHWILSRFIMPSPITDYILQNYLSSKNERDSHVLTFLPTDEKFEGDIKWTNRMKGSLETIKA